MIPHALALTLALAVAPSPADAADPAQAAPAAQAGADWQLQLDDAVAQALAADPDARATVDALPVVTDRAGALALAQLDHPDAIVLLADRLHRNVDHGELRVAVARAFVARGHELPEIVAGLYDLESDPAVQATLLYGLARAPADLALPRIADGLAAADARLRLEAAVVAGTHADAAALAPQLIDALSDGDADVRGRAARALGRHQVADAWAPLQDRLADAQPLVRLQALRALQAIDADRAAALPQLRTLAADPDPRVARAAAGGMR